MRSGTQRSCASTAAPRPVERRRLPATRNGITHKFSIAGFEGYLTANTYDDGALGELFINDVGKEGSTLRGVLAMFAMAASVALQYGAPPEVLARKLAL
jgi:ribonucleoside-diphosphate reductase alpha chain